MLSRVISTLCRRQITAVAVESSIVLYPARSFHTEIRRLTTQISNLEFPGVGDDLDHLSSTNITDYNRKNYLSIRIRGLLDCSNEEAKQFIAKEQSLKKLQPNFVCSIISLLLQEGVSAAFILDNPWILLQQEGDIKSKLSIIKRMKPKKLEDFVPMITLKNEDLLKVAKIIEFQASTTPMGNRIYYFSSRLKAPPHTVTKYFIKYPFMFTKVNRILCIEEQKVISLWTSMSFCIIRHQNLFHKLSISSC